jgi:hypothetical protein
MIFLLIALVIAGIIIVFIIPKKNTAKQTNLNKLRIETMPEEEFITFIKKHHSELDSYLERDGQPKTFYGILSARWLTNNYFVDSKSECDDSSEFVKITRRRDNVVIFSDFWIHWL